jgi:deoxyribonuclease (pyrimidine dimer)
MTRINLIPTAELSDQHLVREYNELPRCIKQDLNVSDAPRVYKLGSGHMKWGRLHIKFLLDRYALLCKEMEYRGFKVNYPHNELCKYAEENVGKHLMNDYQPSEKDIEVSRSRIVEKIEKKHHWYRWTNRFEPVYVLAMRLDMGVH